jgi:hypothetical protein
LYFPGWRIPQGILKWKAGTLLGDNWSGAIANYWVVPIGGNEDFNFVSPAYCLATYSGEKTQLTFGPGFIFTEDDLSLSAQIGAIFAIGKKFAIVTENYWGYDPTQNTYEDNFFALSVAARYNVSRWTFELGAFGGIVIGGDGNGGSALPLLGITWHY